MQTSNTTSEQIEIDLGRLFLALCRRWMAIALSAGVLAAAFFWGTGLVLPPRYESGVMFYVCSASGEELSSEDLSIARKLVESCMVVLNTRQTQQQILDHTGMAMTCQALEKRITAEAMGETEFFRVTVSGDDPIEAEQIADAIGVLLPGRISGLIEGFSVKVADAAVLPMEASGPSRLRGAAAGFGLGVVLSVSAVVFAEIKRQARRPASDCRKSPER